MASPKEDSVKIKHEPADTIPAPASEFPSLKRRRSEDAEDIGEKRQRVSSDTAATNHDSIDQVLEQAAAAAKRSIESLPNTTPIESEQAGIRAQIDGYILDPYLYMRIFSLPILDSLSTQILATFARGSYTESVKITNTPESELGQAYATLKGLFDQTKKIYCQFPEQDGHFLSSDELNIREPNHRETIRTTNLATWVSIVFGAQLFSELNENFIDHFTPRHAPLSKEAGQLCIEFKTQMYLSAVSVEEQEKTKEDLLDELFPSNLESILADRHPDIPISVSEMEFVKDIAARRDFLMIQNDDVDSTQILLEKYAWEDFLQNLSAYLGAAYEPLIAPYMKRHSLTAPSSPARPAKKNNNHQDDIKAQVEQAAEEALRRLHAQTDYQSQLQKNANSSQQHKTYPQQSQNGSYESLYAADPVYPPEQTAPTQVLYEQARQAAVAKANPGNTRRPGLPSQRRPWSTEEEHALMAGLDQVRGPHWSQILSLYGPGGSISEVLKDRNQVQLKDKARNLKLFFLKSSIEVPYYLKCVTGELKTRAPSQAARKEAEDRARQESEESNARSAGIRLLAGGMQPLPGANGLTGNMHAPTPARQQSPSPEHFHVVEPDRRGPGLPATSSSNFDESLRHHLEASNALSSA